MARQKGILKIEGTLDNLTFYKGKEGYLVRTKGGVSKERILNDPNFVRTRENGSEFGLSARSGKQLRTSVRSFIQKAKDARVSNRLTQVMAKIKNQDFTSVRGERNVAQGLSTAEGKQLLKGFDFNDRALLSAVFHAPFSIDLATGEVNVPDLTPTNDISIPGGATHVTLSGAVLNIDFSTGESDISYSPEVNLAIDSTSATQTFSPVAMPTGSGNVLYLVLIEFFQEVNGVQYSLNNGSFNVLNIVEVA